VLVKKEDFFFCDHYKQKVSFSVGSTFYLVKLLTHVLNLIVFLAF